MEEMPSEYLDSPVFVSAAAKARRDFFDASIALFTSCVCN